ncbi:hypothetical protein [Methanolobus sp.]|uniref:hypothetical protein n=1 Tax=Methanolobus sp. TaxID=1874737 RepID=UPI0025D1E95D|nr:hypothetical protein [Methanolobus sp.]
MLNIILFLENNIVAIFAFIVSLIALYFSTKQFSLQNKPILYFERKYSRENDGYKEVMYVENIGKGPAYDIKYNLEYMDSVNS